MVFVDRQLAANKSDAPAAPQDERDVKLLGLSHAEVGAYVLRQWNFPGEITEAIRCQFDPLDCLTQGKLSCLLNTAKFMMATVTRPPPEGVAAAEPDALVMTMLNISIEEYREVLEEVEGRFTLLEIATSDF
jgi:HD-like signal output (HDOD) protein